MPKMTCTKLAMALLAMTGASGCLGSITLAPHLSREADLAPAAAAGRYSTVLRRAAAFEKQNEKSKDVHWYRVWRAAAMVGLGQHAQATALLDQVLADISAAKSSPAQPERLRMFIHDLQAASMRGQGQGGRATELLDRAYRLAKRVELESDGDCDRDLMLAARAQQLQAVATQAGVVPRAARAQAEAKEHMDAWVKCKQLEDYPALAPLPLLAAAAQGPGGLPSAIVPNTNARMPPAIPPPAAAPPPAAPPPAAAPPPPAPAPAGPPSTPAALPRAAVRYAPVNAAPWQAGLDAVAPLLAKRARGAKSSMAIRTDGAHHAIRVTLAKPARRLSALLPVFRSTVVFFERTRDVNPPADRVIVRSGSVDVLAEKSAVMDLFLERVKPAEFLGRLSRLP